MPTGNTTYVYQPGAFTGVVPYMPGTFVRYSVIDVNGDGLTDIVFQFKPNVVAPTVTATGNEAVNSLAIFVNVGGQHFEDRTSTYLTGPTTIGGLAADQIVLDINGDGRADIVYATNQEDSRRSDIWSDYYGPLSILLSGANGYSIVQSSARAWWHGIGSGVLNGQVFLAGSGSPSPEQGTAYIFQNGNLVEAPFHYPQGYGNTPGFFSGPSQSDTRFMIQENRLLGFGIMQGWALDSGGVWQSAGTIDVVGSQPFVKTLQFMPWNGESTVTVDVYLADGRYVMKQLGGLDLVGRMSLSPGGPEIVVFKEYERYIRNFDPASTAVVPEDQTAVVEVLRAFTIQNNQLVAVDLHIEGQIVAVDFEMSDILDFNRDGYQDLVVRPYNQTGVPLVYLNDIHGGFINMNLAVSDPFDYGRGDAASSIVADFNNDGIMDVVTLPANSSGLPYSPANQTMADYRLYLGMRNHPDVQNDFNGDGRSDILWRTSTGTIFNFLGSANGGVVNNGSNSSVAVDPAYSVAGLGDFNGDGRTDILWRNPTNGVIFNFLGTASGGYSSNGDNSFVAAGTNVRVVGIGDFNGDGRADILWRNDAGTIFNFLGTASGGFTSNGANSAVNVDIAYQVAGTGDFNGDGRTDILWRNSSTGVIFNFLGTASGGFSNNGDNSYVAVATSTQVAGIGDFDGDGRSDILWRNGAGTIFNFLGTASGGYANNGGNSSVTVDNAWHIASIADFNGDNRADILWRNDAGVIFDFLGTASGGYSNNGDNSYVALGATTTVQDPFL